MKISNIGIQNNTHFLSKKKNVRLADDIVRKTKLEFPALSPSYIDDYWLCIKKPKHSDRKRNSRIMVNTLGNKLFESRIKCDFLQDILRNPLAVLRTTKEYKLANCIEFAQLTEACLLANGYKDTKLAVVMIKFTLYDKNTKEKVYGYIKPFDHVVVLSRLNEDEKSNKPVVLDGWIGKAMGLSEAKVQYLKMISEEDMEEIISNGIGNYKQSIGHNFNNGGFDFSIKIIFDKTFDSFLKKKFDKNPTKITKMLRAQFPNLILDKTQSQT